MAGLRIATVVTVAIVGGYVWSSQATNAAAFWGPTVLSLIGAMLMRSWWAVVLLPAALLGGSWLQIGKAVVVDGIKLEPRETSASNLLVVHVLIHAFGMVSATAGMVFVETVRYVRRWSTHGENDTNDSREGRRSTRLPTGRYQKRNGRHFVPRAGGRYGGSDTR